MTRRRIPRPPQQHRYRCDGLPGLEVEPMQWSPPPPPDPAQQGWLALDGGFLGPLFNDHPSDTQP